MSKFNILVVDDDHDKQILLKTALMLAGYDVRTAADGLEALAEFEIYQPDLVIADVMMPRLNGYDLARRIRENPQTRFIPIILQTAARLEAEDMRLGSESGALGYITDPTDLDLLLARVRTLLDFKSYLDSCEEAAFTDHSTGLANRRRFERNLEREISRTERYGHPFCLLMLDIDDFKLVNDTHGHEAGDQVLISIGKCLQQAIRGIDLAARIGGDEFAVVLTEMDIQRGIEVASRLVRSINNLDIPPVGKITVSCGVAECPTSGRTGRELQVTADAALYEAKRMGRDRVQNALTLNSNSQT